MLCGDLKELIRSFVKNNRRDTKSLCDTCMQYQSFLVSYGRPFISQDNPVKKIIRCFSSQLTHLQRLGAQFGDPKQILLKEEINVDLRVLFGKVVPHIEIVSVDDRFMVVGTSQTQHFRTRTRPTRDLQLMMYGLPAFRLVQAFLLAEKREMLS